MATNPFLSKPGQTSPDPPAAKTESKHTISLYVANKPGVLVRIAQVFARRSFNIDSLVVSEGRNPRYSRMTIVCQGDPDTLEQIIKQCAKLVDVLHASEHEKGTVIEKEFALVKVKATAGNRSEILQISEHFKAETVDFTEESLILQVSGSTEKLDAMAALLDKYGIVEQVRTGKVLMARGLAET